MLMVFPPVLPESSDPEFRPTSYQIEHPVRMLVLPACVALYFITSLLHTLLQEPAMSAEAARRASMMPLRELVDRYRSLAGEFGKTVPLTAFQLRNAQTDRLFSR